MIATISETKRILAKYQLTAKKKYGQNFLIEPTIINKIVACLDGQENVIEIGPGLGGLTEQLCQCKSVKAYEIDEDMYHVLINELTNDNLEIINQDFLTVDLAATITDKVTIVSNLPYYITSDLLLKLFVNYQKIDKIIVMMQKQVAERFLNTAKGKDYGPLQVISQLYSDVKLVCHVNRNNFYPSPDVDSTVLAFTINKKSNVVVDDKLFLDIVKACFSQRRKFVLKNLKNCGFEIGEEDFARKNIALTSRAEQLQLSDYIKLYEVLK